MDLNEVVLGATKRYFQGSEIELDLSKDLKNDYDGELFEELHVGLLELACEIKQHRGKHKKLEQVSTRIILKV